MNTLHESEQTVLGAMLLNKIDIIPELYFDNNQSKDIFEILKELKSKNIQITEASIKKLFFENGKHHNIKLTKSELNTFLKVAQIKAQNSPDLAIDINMVIQNSKKHELKDGALQIYNIADHNLEKALEINKKLSVEPQGSPELFSDQFILDCLTNDEKGDSELFEALYKNKRLFDHKAGTWMIYKNGSWEYDYKKTIRKQALYDLSKCYLNLSNRLDKQISGLHLEDSAGTNKPEISSLEKKRDELRKRVKQLNKKFRIDNVLDLSTSFLPAVTDEFDTHNLLINLKNGVYDFENDKFNKHLPEYFFVKKAGANYNKSAKCPFIMDFLNTIFNNNLNVINFIQQWAGITLTGMTDLQGFLYCYGSGLNGKTAFFKLLKLLLKDYYVSIPIESLIEKKFNNTDEYHKATLHGARLAVASEIPKDRRLNESQIKDLTGGESVTARLPYGRPFNFTPTHKLALFGNHLLNITGTDEGIWRRVYLLKFDFIVSNDQKIEMSELEKRFKKELDGFLMWCIDGYRKYQESGGLSIPEEIQKATKEYRNESNALQAFIESEYILKGKNFEEELKLLLICYHKWCAENGEYIQYKNSRQLKKALLEKDYLNSFNGTDNKVMIRGVKIREAF